MFILALGMTIESAGIIIGMIFEGMIVKNNNVACFFIFPDNQNISQTRQDGQSDHPTVP